jgi:hypothetical protein
MKNAASSAGMGFAMGFSIGFFMPWIASRGKLPFKKLVGAGTAFGCIFAFGSMMR